MSSGGGVLGLSQGARRGDADWACLLRCRCRVSFARSGLLFSLSPLPLSLSLSRSPRSLCQASVESPGGSSPAGQRSPPKSMPDGAESTPRSGRAPYCSVCGAGSRVMGTTVRSMHSVIITIIICWLRWFLLVEGPSCDRDNRKKKKNTASRVSQIAGTLFSAFGSESLRGWDEGTAGSETRERQMLFSLFLFCSLSALVLDGLVSWTAHGDSPTAPRLSGSGVRLLGGRQRPPCSTWAMQICRPAWAWRGCLLKGGLICGDGPVGIGAWLLLDTPSDTRGRLTGIREALAPLRETRTRHRGI
jgi:hypothetical protein